MSVQVIAIIDSLLAEWKADDRKVIAEPYGSKSTRSKKSGYWQADIRLIVSSWTISISPSSDCQPFPTQIVKLHVMLEVSDRIF